MITVQIGTDSRTMRSRSDIDEAWINQQINRRRRDGQRVCVRVYIDVDGINAAFSTPACGAGGGGRAPNHRERQVFELWHKRGLDQEDFAAGNLVAFLKQLDFW